MGYNENDEDQKDNESKRRGRNHKNIKSNQLKKKTFSIFVFLNKKKFTEQKICLGVCLDHITLIIRESEREILKLKNSFKSEHHNFMEKIFFKGKKFVFFS